VKIPEPIRERRRSPWKEILENTRILQKEIIEKGAEIRKRLENEGQCFSEQQMRGGEGIAISAGFGKKGSSIGNGAITEAILSRKKGKKLKKPIFTGRGGKGDQAGGIFL